jgi:phosphate transport system protein
MPVAQTPVNSHTVKSFDNELEHIRSLVSEMGGLAEAAIIASIDALMRRDADAAMAVVAQDARIDLLEAEVEKLAIATIALRAPMADDLRAIISALKMSALLERIGDYSKNIAKRAATLAQTASVQPMVIIPEMGRAAAGMVRDALDAYVDRDTDLADMVMARDAVVDDFYNSLFRSLLTYMMENPHHITPSAHLLFVAKNLERIGDHATNIAELVHFSVTGEHAPDRVKADETAFIAAPRP